MTNNCPNCGGIADEIDGDLFYEQGERIEWARWECPDCGYTWESVIDEQEDK